MADISSSSSSEAWTEVEIPSDDEVFIPQKKVRNDNYFEIIERYDEKEFMNHFRLSREQVESISNKYETSEYFKYQSGGNGKLESIHQVLVFLWYVGHQTASFEDVSDRFDISKSTLYIIIRKVSYFISNLAIEFITWPDEEEKLVIEEYFRTKNFPGVIGAIDGTHIRIDRPTNDPDSYLNRKHFFSIQVQIVCDHRRKIRHIVAGYPGSVHDGRVFRATTLKNELPQKCGHYYILGDSAYPCLPHLLTPYRNNGNLTEVQLNFNRRLAENRYVVEHCFGILKQKFRQLYHLKLRSVLDMTHLIRACCILHNMSLDDENLIEDHPGPVPMDHQIYNRNVEEEADDQNGAERRDYVANNVLN